MEFPPHGRRMHDAELSAVPRLHTHYSTYTVITAWKANARLRTVCSAQITDSSEGGARTTPVMCVMCIAFTFRSFTVPMQTNSSSTKKNVEGLLTTKVEVMRVKQSLFGLDFLRHPLILQVVQLLHAP